MNKVEFCHKDIALLVFFVDSLVNVLGITSVYCSLETMEFLKEKSKSGENKSWEPWLFFSCAAALDLWQSNIMKIKERGFIIETLDD